MTSGQMSDDERFEEFLRQTAADYNRPPETPRELMWARIDEARRASANITEVVPIGARRRRMGRDWMRLAIGAAAVLAVGVGIGRITARHDARGSATVANASGTSLPGDAVPAPESAGATAGESGMTAMRPGLSRRQPSAGGRAPSDAVGSATTMPNGTTSRAFQLVAIQHLAQTEALLTTFRTNAHGSRSDAQLASWARELLSTTRLLADSPAANDPKMKQLLDDLELVLAQIAQLSAEHGRDDVDLINEAMERHGVMPRLRTAIPAGPVTVGT
jgi:hypothetical protein